MCNIDQIMDMLDGLNSIEVQNRGIELGRKVKCINCFIRPVYEDHCKNVWENCAKILYVKTDEELRPYISELLRWLGDSNWPGYDIILDRLLNYKDVKWLSCEVEECVKIAELLENDKWLIDMSPILKYKQLKECLSNAIVKTLENADFPD